MCCLKKLEAEEARWAELNQSGLVAIEWLGKHYPEDTKDNMLQVFCESLTPDQIEEIGELPQGLQEMFSINLGDWMTTEAGTVDDDDQMVRLIDLALRDGGAPLTPAQREFLEMTADQPMGLYEVVEVKVGEGFWLVDTLDAKSERVWIRDRTASQSIEVGDILGARIVPTEPNVLSGCLYPFPRPQYPRIRQTILDGPKEEGGRPDRGWVSECIIREWLALLVGRMPTLIDSSGQPVSPTTIHFKIKDGKRVEKAIQDQPDVVGDAKAGWSRLEEDRSLYGLQRTKKSHLELFAMTQERAEAGERWLSEIAGDAIEKISSEAHDLSGVMKNRFAEKDVRETKKKNEVLESLSEEERGAFFVQLYMKIYANWANDPIPALGDKTPTEAVRSKKGRQDVAELIRSYEIGEAQKAGEEGRKPVSFDFLWEQVGLRPEDFAR
jgi:hypothetical protein